MFTVKDLIEKLSTMDPDAWVVAGNRSFVPVDSVEQDKISESNKNRFDLNEFEVGETVVKLYL